MVEMSSRSYDALRKMKTELFIHKNSEDIINVYDQWAEEYEEDIDAIGYKIHDESAEVLLKLLADRNTEETAVLDTLCGTGLVGYYLKQRGYRGVIDGVDGSAKMLEKARGKNVYHSLLQKMLVPGEEIVAGRTGQYDGVVLVGGFLQGHLDPKVLPAMADMLKKGGYLVYTARVSEDNESYRMPLENEAVKLVEVGVLKEMEITKTSYGVDWDVEGEGYSDPASRDRTPSTVHIYNYVRIK